MIKITVLLHDYNTGVTITKEVEIDSVTPLHVKVREVLGTTAKQVADAWNVAK